MLEAARDVIRRRGYAATSVGVLCAEAAVTKGAFFHHFDSKEALGVAAAAFWAETTSDYFSQAPYQKISDPLARLRGYIEFRKSIIDGDIAEFTCLAGTLAQEVFDTSPAIRDACAASIFGHASVVEKDIAAAMAARNMDHDFTPQSLSHHIQAVLQGAFILAKASGDRRIAISCIDHLIRYVGLLFQTPTHPVKEADDD